MPPVVSTLEIDLRWLCGLAGLGTLFYAFYNMLLAQSRPIGHTTGSARRLLRTRYLLVVTLLFIIFGVLLWRPLPLHLPWLLQLFIALLGAVIFLASLALYIWGLSTLGLNFNVSSGFGVRLHQAHRLVTSGPYAYIRHPMYLAVILAGWGGLLLYRTWAMLVFAVIMLGMIVRARKEEAALAQAFGAEWEAYQRRVPAYLPRLKLSRKNDRR